MSSAAQTTNLLKVMSVFVKTKVENLSELSYASKLAWPFYELDRERLPFLDPKSPLSINGPLQTSGQGAVSFESFKLENKNKWMKIFQGMKQHGLEDWNNQLEEYKQINFDGLCQGQDQDIFLLCILILMFLKMAYPNTYKRIEELQPQALASLSTPSSYDSQSKSVSTLVRKNSHLLRESGQSGSEVSQPKTAGTKFSTPLHLIRSDSRGSKRVGESGKTEKDLLKVIGDFENELRMVKEELVYKDKQNFELQDKVAQLKKDKTGLSEQVEDKDALISKLSFRVETLEECLEENPQKEGVSRSLELANQKIDDLFEEINVLQKKNAQLKSSLERKMMEAQLPQEGVASLDDESIEEQMKKRLRVAQRENEVLVDKIEVLNSNVNTLSDKLLKEKQTVASYCDQLNSLHKTLTQQEISVKAMENERNSLKEENEYNKRQVLTKDFQIKQLEQEFNSIIAQGSSKYDTSKKLFEKPVSEVSNDDSNLELVKICKEVNNNYLNELKCVYALLHDTFVSELTGKTLDDLIKKRLEFNSKTSVAI